jgi:hypothetical protein
LVPPHSAASQAQCEDGDRRYENGDIIVRGINTTNFIAGRLEMCVGTEWWALCDNGWDFQIAMKICRKFSLNKGKSVQQY